ARGVVAGSAELAPGRGPDSARRLFDLVRREALPESSRAGIRASDVLAELGVADPADLYPAPARLPALDDPLPAPAARAIADAVRAHPGAVVVAHGPAGAGKTTALRQLGAHLPPGSVVAVFDCYGGGEYLSSGEERHTAQRFVTQTVNDLAQRCGTPLLIQPPAVEEDLWRRLRRMLEGAVNALDPGGVLVLAVDAADNAVFAAGERGDRGFVPGLVGLRMSPRVTVVLTARSHRAESLGVPAADRVEIQPFDAATSAAHLRRYRPDASDADAAEFHARTDGNPRTQYYALTRAAEDGRDMPALLEACARTPDTLFEEIVNSGLEVSGADAGGRRWLALMLALAHPVSTSTLAAALGVDPAAVVAFAHGLAPGVSVAGEAIQFRDEDFETYVRSRVSSSDVAEAHDRLADMFLADRARDADAAAHVADHLFAVSRLDEVLQLVVDEDWPEAIPDGFRRAQVQSRRLDLAARAAAATGSASSAVRVAIRACDTASRLGTLSSLVESRLDLVARYADVELLRGYALRQSSRNGWLAPVHMRLAAALARDPARHAAARTELDRAEAWLRRWVTSPREETRGWDVDPDDAACAAEARYRLDGLDAALVELDKWRPSEFATAVAAALAARVAAEEGPGRVRDALRAHGVPTAAQAPFLAYAASAIALPDRGWVNEVIAALLAIDPGRERPWHSRLIDVAARHGDRESAVSLARHWARPLPSHRWGFSSGDADGVAALRARAAAAALSGTGLDLDDLVPLSLRPRNQEPDEAGASHGVADDSRSHERREWAEIAGPLLAAALLAARAAVGVADTDEVAAFAAGGLAGRTEKSGHRWFTFDSSYRAWAALVADAALDVAAGPELIEQLAGAAPALLRDGAPALWLDLAAGLARRGAHPDRAADLCRQAAARARTDAYPAPDRLDLLSRAAEIAGSVAPELGRQLFDQAVDAATGINDGAARLLAVHADLATRAAIGAADRAAVASQLIRAAEAVAPHVTDSDVIPYEAVAGAAGRLDADVALAAVSRWDDEDRIRLGRTLPSPLLGAVDGGGVPAAHALALGHLVEDDLPRLQYLLAVIDRLREGAAGIAAARVALNRAAAWIRCDVPARAQPALAGRLLDWAAERGLDGHIRAAMDPVVQLACDETDRAERWRGADPPAEAQALLAEPSRRGWTTLADDATLLAEASVSGDQIREFVAAVASTAPAGQRVSALTAIADLPDRVGVAITLPVLAQCLGQWRDWPGVTDWAAAALPRLLTRHLPSLFWWQDTGPLAEQLRAFASDDDIRRAVLSALPEARPRLTAYDWQNIASLLGRLCGPDESAATLTALLADRLPHSGAGDAAGAGAAVTDPAGPLPLLLWSAFGHPRRETRWRAAHAARDLLFCADLPAATGLVAALVSCLDRADAGPYRDPALHFYRLSAAAALLAALARVAADKPAVLAAQLPALARH
ncbi:MAG TPA: ATP-binding protein, partial [Vicinamibacterales bacterium]|nr:ATP-binding protein [Vicinamibacterales bacterium]